MQNPPKHSVTGTQAREKVFGIQIDKSRYSDRGATYERDAFGRTINLVEAGGVGWHRATPLPAPQLVDEAADTYNFCIIYWILKKLGVRG